MTADRLTYGVLGPQALQELKELHDGTGSDFWIGKTGSDTYSLENRADDAIVRTTDAVLSALGIEPSQWVRQLVATSEFRGSHEVFANDKRNLERAYVPLGAYIVRRTYAELEIEQEESGNASVHVSLRMPDGYTARFSGEGEFWTEDAAESEDTSGDIGYEIEVSLWSIIRPNGIR